MALNQNYSKVLKLLNNVETHVDYPLKNLNKYGTGGSADIVVFPTSAEQLNTVVNVVKGECNYAVLGGGSNVLISDKGFRGVIISTIKVNKIVLKGNLIIADAGAFLGSVIREMADNCFSGLEFAVGIPATVGGGVCMNAGCYDKCVGDVVKYVVTNLGTYSNKECGFSYRKSRFVGGETILKVCFNAEPSEEDIIMAQLKAYKSFRRNPKGKSCGSVFRNDGFFAGKVLDECGLKGYSVGGASISNEHANFMIANDGCTSQDIYNLIKIAKEKVYQKKQIQLNEEIVYLGEF